jgi:excisionase family DNA binding protein
MTTTNVTLALTKMLELQQTLTGIPDDAVDLKCLSFLANISERQLYRHMASGRLRAIKGCPGRQVKFSREEVARYLGAGKAEEMNETAGAELAVA